MSEPCKMFSLVLPFGVYERLKTIARERETSIGGLLREGANPTFAIRTEKQLFLGTHRPVTLEFKGVLFPNGL